MNTHLRPLALACLALLSIAARSAYAQDADDSVQPEPDPVFDIEVIVFEYVDGVRGAREDWRYTDSGRDAVARSQPDLMESTADDDDESGIDTTSGNSNLPGSKTLSFEPILGENLRLGDTFAQLRNSRDFRPIAHAGWRQPIFDRSNETTLDLARVARLPSNLDGKASVYVSRFLHLTLDLQLADNRAVSSGLDSIVFKLNERRKLRSGELNFYDHPRFGALALISKTDQPAVSAPSE